MINRLIFVLLIFCASVHLNNSWTQDSSKFVNPKNLSIKAEDIERLLKSGANPVTIAQKYEEIGREFKLKNQTKKAIQYYNKAVDYYKKANQNNEASRILREIAQLQESRKEFNEAAVNYEKSATISNSSISRNDAARVAAPSAESKISINQQTIEQIKETDNLNMPASEQAIVYYNQAKLYEEIGKKEEALSYGQEALNILKEHSNKNDSREYNQMKVKLSNELSNLYLKNEQFENALQNALSSRQLAVSSGDLPLILESSNDLSELYIRNQDYENALLILKDAYRLALKSGRTSDARLALTALIRFFNEQKDTDSQLIFYEDFIGQLDSLVARDSSLIDEKIFFAKEDRITQLEKERLLQDELLKKSRNWNYGMVIFFSILLIASVFLFWSFMKVRMKNKKIALQSLRREMNPHFIFNSLNSINRFIAQNDEIRANQYLTSYAQLMRTTMEISSHDFIRLDREIELLQKYLNLEHLRFSQHFDFEFIIDESIEIEHYDIPGFLVQPHIENAIWHGLRYKKTKGQLTISIQERKGNIVVSVQDDGIGLEESRKIKTENQKSHESRGFSNIKERIELLNSLYKYNITMNVTSPVTENSGTLVEIIVPKITHHG